MKIWIVNPYGELPSEGWREYRSFMLAKALAARGHDVTWWISDFVHRSKKYRPSGELVEPALPPGARVISVHTTPYVSNISLARIRYEGNYGQEMARLGEKEARPDVIVMGDPSLFFSKPVLAYRNKVGCKLVLDVIDLWPELFEVALPKWLRPLGRLIFYPLYQRRNKLVRACDGVVAVSRDYLRIALQDQSETIPGLVAYLGIDNKGHAMAKVNSSLDAILKQFRTQFALTAVYAGTLGDAYDIDIVIAAVKRAKLMQLPIGFVVAGEGPRKLDMHTLAESHTSHFKFVGRLPASDMATLYANCDVGLMTYVVGSTVAMPVKFYDYLAGGVAILNSLGRDVGEIIENQRVGLNYQPSNLDDFMDKLLSMLRQPPELKTYKENASQLVSAYDTKIQYGTFSKFLESL